MNYVWIVLLLMLSIFGFFHPTQSQRLTHEERMERDGWERCGSVVDTYYDSPSEQTPANILVQMSDTRVGSWKRSKWFGRGTEYINPNVEGFLQWQEWTHPLLLSDGRKVFSTREIPELGIRELVTCDGITRRYRLASIS